MSAPTLSIVMPVFNTGALLLEAARSVQSQTLFQEEGDGFWELLIVDDGSKDEETLRSLTEAAALSSSIRILKNERTKGAAGARNTGVFAARGLWIGFLDSDDLLHVDFLRRQRDAFTALPDARWRAAHFELGDDLARVSPSPVSRRSPCLYELIESDYVLGRVSVLRRPVGVLLRCGCVGIMTVQIRRDLIQSVGGFNETYVCAEDYDLWLRVANIEDLAIAPLDAGIYRVRANSLTKSGRPMFYGEDRMLLNLKVDRAFGDFASEIDVRLRKVYTKFCFHFRQQRSFAEAARFARKLIRLRPFDPGGWRQLLASTLRR